MGQEKAEGEKFKRLSLNLRDKAPTQQKVLF